MKSACKYAFRTFMMKKLSDARTEKHLTQAKFAEQLMLDTRSYAAIEKGEYGCCALTLILYLVFCCDDVPGFIEEVRPVLLREMNAQNAS